LGHEFVTRKKPAPKTKTKPKKRLESKKPLTPAAQKRLRLAKKALAKTRKRIAKKRALRVSSSKVAKKRAVVGKKTAKKRVVKKRPIAKRATAKKKPAAKVVKKTAKKSPAKRLVRVTLNQVSIRMTPGRKTVASLVRMTSVPLERAVCRVNGRRYSLSSSVVIKAGDAILVRRVKLPALEREGERPKKKGRKKGLTKQERTILKSKTILIDGVPAQWVAALPEEYLRRDGSVASNPSRLRTHRNAAGISRTLKWLAKNYGKFSDKFNEFALTVQMETGYTLQEVYTLFFSP
jgi:hypothetical protein